MTIAPPTFPKLFQRDIHLRHSTAILQVTERLIQANSRQEPVNRVKCAAQGKRSERDGEVYGKSRPYNKLALNCLKQLLKLKFCTLGARGFFLVRGDRLERRSQVVKRQGKNLRHQRITTSLPCRRQSPLIDIRSLLFSHLGKTGLAKIIVHLTNSSPFKKRFFNRPIRFPGSNFDSEEINGNMIGSARSKDLTA